MKRTYNIALIVGTVLLLTSFKTTSPRNTFSLTVRVEGLRNAEGVVQIALYNHGGTLPDEKYERYYKMGKTTINDGRAVYTFHHLPSGSYAVNILHDENENGKIDKGLILPKEGIGFSNYETINLMNRPKFSKARFTVSEDCQKTIKVVYL